MLSKTNYPLITICKKLHISTVAILSAIFISNLILFPINGNAQTTCNDCFGSCDALQLQAKSIVCGAYPDTYGPYYVKVYLYFIVPVSPPGINAFVDPLDDRSEAIWGLLQNAFSNHHIYFVPGFGNICDPSQNYMTIFSDIDPSNILTAVDEVQQLSTSYAHTDGIDVYVFRDDLSPGDAASFCIPSSYLALAGTDLVATNEILSKTPIVSHEMAHCLGLLHTFEVTCLDTDGSDCLNKGDMVCDTPPDQSNYGSYTGTCTPSLQLSTDYLNIMSGYKPPSCLTHFTPEQGKRMRYYLENKIGALADVRNDNIIITGTETWTTPVSPEANIIIKPGGRLNIYAPVTMNDGAHIYVEAGDLVQQLPGGILSVYSTITAACDFMWEGIIVAGYGHKEQISLYQGKVSVGFPGVIEHARCGIRAQGWNAMGEWQTAAGGGMVSSVFGKFQNNITGVYLPYYADMNISYFGHCQFLTTDDYRGGEDDMPTYLNLEIVRRVRLNACQFRDDRTDTYNQSSTRANGILANDAYVEISGTSTFTNLFEGLHVSNTLADPGNSVIGATFSKCFTGIYSQYGNHMVFDNNIFSMGFPSNYLGSTDIELKGVELDGTVVSLGIQNNTFTDTEASNIGTIGTDLIGLGIANHRLINNTFLGLETGTKASGTNAFQSPDGLIFSGLSYLCNEFDSNEEYDNLVVNGGIRKEQGARSGQDARISTGNRYNEQLLFPLACQFCNAGARIEYHHRPGTSEELVNGFYTLNLVEPLPSIENTECGQVECPPPCDSESELSSLKSQFFSDKQVWLSKTAAYHAIIDTTQQQAEAIAINRLRYNMDKSGQRILLHYALDTTAIKKDSVLTWLGRMATYDADMALARHRFFEGDYTAADSLFLLIPTRYSLNGQLLTDYTDTRTILNLIRPSLQSGVLIQKLPAATLDTIESGWGTECFTAGSLARNILYRNGRRLKPDCSAESQRPSNNTVYSNDLKPVRSKMALFPNPARNTLTISNVETVGESFIRIVDSSFGHIILEQEVAPGQETVIIDLSPLPASGLYFIALMDKGGLIRNIAKLILTR